MSDLYILTTDRIRDLYTWAYAWRSQDRDSDTDLSGLRESNRSQFDSWLAEHDREVRAEALEAEANRTRERIILNMHFQRREADWPVYLPEARDELRRRAREIREGRA